MAKTKKSLELDAGMGVAVAERTFLRKDEKGWDDIAQRVALGNSLLCKTAKEKVDEYDSLYEHIRLGRLLTSGRHLQHGDSGQPTRNGEVFTNCCSAVTAFHSLQLLLNGSGVGRCFDDDLMLVDWDNMPNVLCVLDSSHKDFQWGLHMTPREAKHKYGNSANVIWHDVDDSREGLADALKVLEVLAFEGIHRDKLLILNYTPVRCKGSPIAGMQGRPASGPCVSMAAMMKIAAIKGAKMPRWKQAMYVDHYSAETVLMGGVRRSARLSMKYWKDPDIFEFVSVKLAADGGESFLWSSNNSVGLDDEFWRLALGKGGGDLGKHARKLYRLMIENGYLTGEPGSVNADKIEFIETGMDRLKADDFPGIGRAKYYFSRLLDVARGKKYKIIPNPCGEANLALWAGYCCIADLAPYHCDTIEQFVDAAKASVRFLIRVNQMRSVYEAEAKRTNRIGVCLTGVHEWAWKWFKAGFYDMLNEEHEVWKVLDIVRRAVHDEAVRYSAYLGVEAPHTETMIKPSGTISKLFALSEGWHLPEMLFYMRWVQFKVDDPLVAKYRKNGYPVRELKTYQGTCIVGFPTETLMARLNTNAVTAESVSIEDHYKWVMLGEKHWVNTDRGGQISYTIVFDPKKVSKDEYRAAVSKYQPKVKCTSVLPMESNKYEYQPNERITKEEYDAVLGGIKRKMSEDVDQVHVDCAGGACPTDFRK